MDPGFSVFIASMFSYFSGIVARPWPRRGKLLFVVCACGVGGPTFWLLGLLPMQAMVWCLVFVCVFYLSVHSRKKPDQGSA